MFHDIFLKVFVFIWQLINLSRLLICLLYSLTSIIFKLFESISRDNMMHYLESVVLLMNL